MTKKLSLLFALMLSTLMASAHDIEVKNADGVTIYYNYINNGTELAVTYRGDSYSYSNEYQGNVVIPEEVTYMNRTRKVTSIGSDAFRGCSQLTSITIPYSVTSIGSDALAYCSGLTSVIIPNSVTSIGEVAFQSCSGLTSITIPNSVTSIGSEAFSWCSGLTSISVESGNEKYDSRNNCNAIIETASNTLIAGCKNTVIPNSVTSIGRSVFSGCSGLTSVTIPNSVTSIGGYAFSGCYNLTSVTIPNSVTSIGENAFCDCSGLTSIIIPNSVTNIGNQAFLYCFDLTSIEIPNSVTSIGSSTFSGCYNLTSVTIPNSVTSIGWGAFYGCYNLTSVTIPNSVTSIGENAFLGCSLTSVTIPNSVTSIGNGAFQYCSGLTSVISLIENPFAITGKTSDSRTFTENTFNNATLYVPKGTIEKYKATDGWKDFVFIEEGEGGGDTPETQKCSTPTITYENGKLTFDCETEGVEYVSSITPPSAFNSGSKTVSMPTTYKVTVYATKSGYEDSDIVTQEINVSGGSTAKKGDVNEDGTVNGTDIQEVINIIVNAE